MKTVVFITGASRGLGLAIAELFLKDDDVRVIGISRRQTIESSEYRHITLDLSDIEAVDKFKFPVDNYDKYILINNAGVVSPIEYVGHGFTSEIINNYNINLIAPSLLTNMFLSQFGSGEKNLHIINVSSGAGKNAYDGWSVYCATKAGLDIFSETIKKEIIISGKQDLVKIHSIAPGVVDTDMQGVIRSSSTNNFSNLEKFKEMYKDKVLVSPESVALKYKYVIDNVDEFPDVVISVRDF